MTSSSLRQRNDNDAITCSCFCLLRVGLQLLHSACEQRIRLWNEQYCTCQERISKSRPLEYSRGGTYLCALAHVESGKYMCAHACGQQTWCCMYITHSHTPKHLPARAGHAACPWRAAHEAGETEETGGNKGQPRLLPQAQDEEEG